MTIRVIGAVSLEFWHDPSESGDLSAQPFAKLVDESIAIRATSISALLSDDDPIPAGSVVELEVVGVSNLSLMPTTMTRFSE